MSILKGKNIFDVSGKVVLVTGAGNGLGKGYANVYAESGCKVACADINKEACENTVAEILAAGGQAKSFHVDVTDIESINALAIDVLKEFGNIDILVNNAGLEIAQPFLDVTPSNFDKINSVNIRGVYFVSQAMAKHMKSNGGGKIINIGSLGSFIGLAKSSAYCATKGAIIQLSKTMAIELADSNIQVNCIAPGYFITPMTQAFYDDNDHRAWIEDRIPLGRWGTIADLAGPLLFLSSNASDYVTGHTVIVDGGWLSS